MSGVCQISGCSTTEREVESELEQYMSGFCQVDKIHDLF